MLGSSVLWVGFQIGCGYCDKVVIRQEIEIWRFPLKGRQPGPWDGAWMDCAWSDKQELLGSPVALTSSCKTWLVGVEFLSQSQRVMHMQGERRTAVMVERKMGTHACWLGLQDTERAFPTQDQKVKIPLWLVVWHPVF